MTPAVQAEEVAVAPEPVGITVTLEQLVIGRESLRELAAKEMRASVAFRLKSILKGVTEHLSVFDETRQELATKYGEPGEVDAQGQQIYTIPEKNMKKVDEEFKALLAQEVSLPGRQLNLFDLGDVTVSAQVLNNLDWLIKE